MGLKSLFRQIKQKSKPATTTHATVGPFLVTNAHGGTKTERLASSKTPSPSQAPLSPRRKAPIKISKSLFRVLQAVATSSSKKPNKKTRNTARISSSRLTTTRTLKKGSMAPKPVRFSQYDNAAAVEGPAPSSTTSTTAMLSPIDLLRQQILATQSNVEAREQEQKVNYLFFYYVNLLFTIPLQVVGAVPESTIETTFGDNGITFNTKVWPILGPVLLILNQSFDTGTKYQAFEAGMNDLNNHDANLDQLLTELDSDAPDVASISDAFNTELTSISQTEYGVPDPVISLNDYSGA